MHSFGRQMDWEWCYLTCAGIDTYPVVCYVAYGAGHCLWEIFSFEQES